MFVNILMFYNGLSLFIVTIGAYHDIFTDDLWCRLTIVATLFSEKPKRRSIKLVTTPTWYKL